MYIKAIPAIYVNAFLAGILSGIITLCLHLSGILSIISLDNIKLLSFLISSSGTIMFYINKVIKPTKEDIEM